MATEKIEKIEQRIEQLKNQKKAIVQREKEKERKERTRRLIQMGALTEKYLGITEVEELEEWLKKYVGHDEGKEKDQL